MKFVCCLLLIFLVETFAVFANCAKEVYALEVLSIYDPCEGRVCQHLCPCGKMIHFNLESELKKKLSAGVYEDVCISDSTKSVTSEGNIFLPRVKYISTGTTPHIDDTGFLFQQLTKAFETCGYNSTYQSFGELKKKIEPSIHIQINDKEFSVSLKPNPQNAMLQFVILLKDFAKVCKKKNDWRVQLSSNLDLALDEVIKTYSKDLHCDWRKMSRNDCQNNLLTCPLNQLQVIKNNFEKLLLGSTPNIRQYCSCQKLTEHQITKLTKTKVSFNKYTYMTNQISYPFKKYLPVLVQKCEEVCSGSVVFEYEEE
jgi:hypothetical protein